jgi:hypothetical protein
MKENLLAGFAMGTAVSFLAVPTWLPHDAIGWVSLAIALLSAYLSWAKRPV